MTKDAYWFPHDSNARHDPKMTRLRMKYKVEGFGAYWCCIEFLRDQSGYEATREDFEALLFEMGIKEAIFESILSIGLLTEKDGAIYSESLKNRMFEWDERKRKLSEAGKRGGRPVKARKKGGLREVKARPKPTESNNITGHNNNNSTGETIHKITRESFSSDFEKQVFESLQPCFGDRLEKLNAKTYTRLIANLSRENYPGVDICQQIKKAGVWEDSNPTRKKTSKGLPKFLTGWMDRAQNSNRGRTKTVEPLSASALASIEFDTRGKK